MRNRYFVGLISSGTLWRDLWRLSSGRTGLRVPNKIAGRPGRPDSLDALQLLAVGRKSRLGIV